MHVDMAITKYHGENKIWDYILKYIIEKYKVIYQILKIY